MSYAKQCELGRAHAGRDIELSHSTGLPYLVNQLRAAAMQENGYSVGYLTKLAELAAR